MEQALESTFTLGVNLQLNVSRTIQKNYSIISTLMIRVIENKNKLKEPANLYRQDFYEFLKMGKHVYS